MYHDSDVDCLWLDVVDEGIRLVMLFVCSVLLSRSLLPSVVLGEEGVGVGGCVVNLDQARLQLTRTPRPLPRMKINPDVKDLFSFRYEDFELEGYDPWPHIAATVSV